MTSHVRCRDPSDIALNHNGHGCMKPRIFRSRLFHLHKLQLFIYHLRDTLYSHVFFLYSSDLSHLICPILHDSDLPVLYPSSFDQTRFSRNTPVIINHIVEQERQALEQSNLRSMSYYLIHKEEAVQ